MPTPEQRAQSELEGRVREQIARAIAPDLFMACDQLCEEVAAIAQSYGGAGKGGDDANVVDALLSIWKIRWELGLYPKQAAKMNDDTADQEMVP